MKSISFSQGFVLVICILAPIGAYKFLDSPSAAAASMIAGMVATFLMGRSDPPQEPPASSGPSAKVIGFIGAATLALAIALPGCSLFTSQNAKTVLDIAQVACIIAHAESQDATVAQVCNVADTLIPDLQRILGEQRKALAKAKKAAACHK